MAYGQFKPKRTKKCQTCSDMITARATNCRSCFGKIRRAKSSGFLGKTHSEYTKVKISKSITRLFKDKKNHPRWKEDREKLVKDEKKHFDGRYREWMRGVKNRDGWKCKIFNGDCSGRLEAHHILRWSDFPELRYEVNNGITLCAYHHPKKRGDEERLSPYFRELVDKA